MGIIWQVALTYIGAVIGAGFASGQEILQFFAVFGGKGLLGAAVAAGMFALIGGEVLILAQEIKAKSYQTVLDHLCGRRLGDLRSTSHRVSLHWPGHHAVRFGPHPGRVGSSPAFGSLGHGPPGGRDHRHRQPGTAQGKLDFGAGSACRVPGCPLPLCCQPCPRDPPCAGLPALVACRAAICLLQYGPSHRSAD